MGGETALPLPRCPISTLQDVTRSPSSHSRFLVAVTSETRVTALAWGGRTGPAPP